MREMVLNDASVSVPHSNPAEISAWLRELAEGIQRLLEARVVQRSLRTARNLYDTQCLSGYSLFDAYLELRSREYREEFRLFMGLNDRQPLLIEIGSDMEDRFLACEEQTLPAPDGEPLVLCAIADWIAIGFPSAPIWDRDRITVRFNELLPDGTIEEASEEIDQLTRPAHAGSISDRHRERLLNGQRSPGFMGKPPNGVSPPRLRPGRGRATSRIKRICSQPDCCINSRNMYVKWRRSSIARACRSSLSRRSLLFMERISLPAGRIMRPAHWMWVRRRVPISRKHHSAARFAVVPRARGSSWDL